MNWLKQLLGSIVKIVARINAAICSHNTNQSVKGVKVVGNNANVLIENGCVDEIENDPEVKAAIKEAAIAEAKARAFFLNASRPT